MMKLFWKLQRMAKLWILSRSESWGSSKFTMHRL